MSGNDEHSNIGIPDEVLEEAMEALPEEQREKVEHIMVSQFAAFARLSPESEVSKKITSEHITQMLSNQERGMELTHKDETQKRIVFCIVIIILIIAVIVIITLLKDTPEVMEKILTVLITAIVSGIGGYGIGKSRSSSDD